MSYESNPVSTGYAAVTGGKNDWRAFVAARGWEHATGFQLRYVYFLAAGARARLTVDEIPFDEIRRRGASMYRGVA